MSGPKTTLAIIEDLIAYRDRVTDRADRNVLADVANELSSLNALKADLLGALQGAVAVWDRHYLSLPLAAEDDEFGAMYAARAAIAKATGEQA